VIGAILVSGRSAAKFARAFGKAIWVYRASAAGFCFNQDEPTRPIEK
jgi:hypothetical protein